MAKKDTPSSAELSAEENVTESTLTEKESALKELESVLKTKETELNERETKLAKKESELKEFNEKNVLESQLAEKTTSPGLKFKFNGLEFKFIDSAPKQIRINGAVKSQKEIVKDDDLLLQLVGGGSGLIEKI